MISLILNTDIYTILLLVIISVFNFQYYEEIFETPFLKATGQFYKIEAAKLLQECTISEYLEKVQQKLHEEALRVTTFVHPTYVIP